MKLTGQQIESYANVFRFENDESRKIIYKDRALKGAEFLLWAMEFFKSKFGIDGTYYSELCCDQPPDRACCDAIDNPSLLDMGTVGKGFLECYRSFGNQKYYNVALKIAEFLYNNPPYPHLWYNDNFKYYGNPNHLGMCLDFLANFYSINGNQKYLDLCLQLAEELFAWQDYKHILDPWQESGSTNGNWDGGWYWYMYDPDPLPPGCVPNGNPAYNGKAADRRMGYHTITMDGIIKFAVVIEQQILAGTTTIRNNQTLPQFRNNIINSIIRAVNFIIDNQEIEDSGNTKYRGLIKAMKWYRNYNGGFTDFTYVYNSGSVGLGSLVTAFNYLNKTQKLSDEDRNNLNSIINSVSTKLITVRNWGIPDGYAVVMHQWQQYIESIANISQAVMKYHLVNKSFEDKDIIWELWSWDGTGVEISDYTANSGKKSVHLTDSNTNGSKWCSILLNAEPNVSYSVEAYAKIENGNQSLYIHFYNSALDLLTTHYTSVSENEQFTRVNLITPPSPPNTSYMDIKLYADWYGTSGGYWDDVNLLNLGMGKNVDDYRSENTIDYLIDNYPNPFNSQTTILYSLKNEGNVKIVVYDVLGNELQTLVNEKKVAGSYEIIYSPSKLNSGIYFITLQSDYYFTTKKVILMK